MPYLVSEKDYISTSALNGVHIEHHGIKGQKWGVRRFQNPDGTLTDAGKKRYSNAYQKEGVIIPLDAVVGGAYAVALAGTVASAMIKSGMAKSRESKAVQRAMNAKIDPKTGIPLKSKPMTEDEDMKLVNPGRGSDKIGTNYNCTFCSTAYDLRRRGFEVTAKQSAQLMSSDDYKKFYKGAETTFVEPTGHEKMVETIKKSPWAANTWNPDFRKYHKEMKSQIKNNILSQGDGARGYLGVTWMNASGGHSMIYEVKNGKIIIRDCQIGKEVNFDKILNNSCLSRYTRIDDKEPNYDEMRKYGVI